MHLFPTLYTQRLKLRKMEIEDVPSLVQYANNKNISDHIINIPYPYQEPDAAFRMRYVVQGFQKKTRYVFAITLQAQAELIGEISLHLSQDAAQAELGYWVGEPFWGKGIATEAAEAVLKFGFEKLNLELIFATCHQENRASEKVLLNNGMQKASVNGNVALYKIETQVYDNQIFTKKLI